MMLPLLFEEHGRPIHSVSAYARQVACQIARRTSFTITEENVLFKLDSSAVLAGGLNVHIEREKDDLKCQGGLVYSTVNTEGEPIHDLAETNSLVILNSQFEKTEEHLVTDKSGRKPSQTDFILASGSVHYCALDCESVPGESAATQHRLVA